MKLLSTLPFIFLFAIQGLFSQNHLLPAEQHGYDFTWQYIRTCGGFPCQNLGWDSRLSIGYTHAGRFNMSVAWYSRDDFGGDIITPTSHFFDSEIGFAILKEGINNMPITFNGIAGIRIGGSTYFNQNITKIGFAVYKRIERSKTFSINPGLRFVYLHPFNEILNYGSYELLLSCDFLFNKFKIGPYITPGIGGSRLGFTMGFVLPTLTR